jgi:hypothetical protein
MDCLKAVSWKLGNVRELKNVIEETLDGLSQDVDEIDENDLPERIRQERLTSPENAERIADETYETLIRLGKAELKRPFDEDRLSHADEILIKAQVEGLCRFICDNNIVPEKSRRSARKYFGMPLWSHRETAYERTFYETLDSMLSTFWDDSSSPDMSGSPKHKRSGSATTETKITSAEFWKHYQLFYDSEDNKYKLYDGSQDQRFPLELGKSHIAKELLNWMINNTGKKGLSFYDILEFRTKDYDDLVKLKKAGRTDQSLAAHRQTRREINKRFRNAIKNNDAPDALCGCPEGGGWMWFFHVTSQTKPDPRCFIRDNV